jgi:hypothetical protein
LDKYPVIERVWVDEYGNNRIDIILSVKDPFKDYYLSRDEVKSYIWNLAKMAGVTSRFNIYP